MMVYLPDKAFSLVFSKINDMCSDLALTSSVLSLFGLVAFEFIDSVSSSLRKDFEFETGGFSFFGYY